MKSGIISVGNNPVLLRNCESALPAEHNIIAVRHNEHLHCVEWLVEGPYMLEHDGTDPPRALLIFTVHRDDDTGAISATGHFDHNNKIRWNIGNWDSWDDCKAWMSGDGI